MSMFGNNLLQGLLGNLSEVPLDFLNKEYGAYLMDGENIHVGFKLVRDALIITDRRIISFDKQGATGQKMLVESIYLDSIYYVTAETSGFGLDDCQLDIEYISSPCLRAHNAKIQCRTFEFPKRYNIQGLYKMLQEIAYQNYTRLNT